MALQHRTILSVVLLLPIMLLLTSCEPDEIPDQEEDAAVEHRKSPIVISSVTYEDTYIKIVYGQPYKRGRNIFGGLEPFGEVWRTGANEATEITLTNDILMDGNLVEAGTYALFSIPRQDEWTIILNSQLGQWGAFNYNSDYDYLRFTTSVKSTDSVVEALTITFDDVENSSTLLTIAWDDTFVEIPIEFI
jgi:hypothetical protein